MPDSHDLQPLNRSATESFSSAYRNGRAAASLSDLPHDNEVPEQPPQRLPLGGLLALSTAGFLTIMTEALPAGVLPAMSVDLVVSQPAAGQTVTVFAIGSALAAIPLTKATISWPRRRLLLIALAGFAVANTVTAISADYWLTLAARFVAGVVAGLVWALLAGYARRMVTPGLQGRAMAVAMAGTPVALAVGVPLGTVLSQSVGWRWVFAAMTLLTAGLLIWVVTAIPEFAGERAGNSLPVRRTLLLPGVAAVLFVTLTLVLAHNVLYTYIAAYLEPLKLAERVDAVLLAFGVASVASIWITGLLIDRHLRSLTLIACATFASAATALWLLGQAAFGISPMPADSSSPAIATGVVLAGAILWGLAFGGIATLLQTASAQAAGAAGDVAQSLIVTGWNIGIAGGGLLGGAIVAQPEWLPLSTLLLVIPAGVTVFLARSGFPATYNSHPKF